MRPLTRFAQSTWMLIVAAGATGCLSMQNQPSLEALERVGNPEGAKPFVEAFVEYRGPQEKWVGPTTFLLHVVAKDAGVARISVMPALFGAPRARDPKDGATAARTLASQGMTGEAARNHMNAMASAIQGGDEPFSGCLSPVKARLIRADGVVLEKQGCRGQTGWPKAASDAVNQFLMATLNGVR